MDLYQFDKQTDRLKIHEDIKEYMSPLLGVLLIPMVFYVFSGGNQGVLGVTTVVAFSVIWVGVKLTVLSTQAAIYDRERFSEHHDTTFSKIKI